MIPAILPNAFNILTTLIQRGGGTGPAKPGNREMLVPSPADESLGDESLTRLLASPLIERRFDSWQSEYDII